MNEDELEIWEEIGWENYAEMKVEKYETIRGIPSKYKKPRLFRVGPPRAWKNGGYNRKPIEEKKDEFIFYPILDTLVRHEYTCKTCGKILIDQAEIRAHSYKFKHDKYSVRTLFIKGTDHVRSSRRSKAFNDMQISKT